MNKNPALKWSAFLMLITMILGLSGLAWSAMTSGQRLSAVVLLLVSVSVLHAMAMRHRRRKVEATAEQDDPPDTVYVEYTFAYDKAPIRELDLWLEVGSARFDFPFVDLEVDGVDVNDLSIIYVYGRNIQIHIEGSKPITNIGIVLMIINAQPGTTIGWSVIQEDGEKHTATDRYSWQGWIRGTPRWLAV
jgi:hypothetical protein